MVYRLIDIYVISTKDKFTNKQNIYKQTNKQEVNNKETDTNTTQWMKYEVYRYYHPHKKNMQNDEHVWKWKKDDRWTTMAGKIWIQKEVMQTFQDHKHGQDKESETNKSNNNDNNNHNHRQYDIWMQWIWMKARQNARVISRTSKLRPLGWVIIKERRGAGSLIYQWQAGGWGVIPV